MKSAFHPSLANYCKTIISEFNQVPQDRQRLLKNLGKYIASKAKQQKAIKLVVICTHNSRRSHIGQLWLKAAAQWYDIPKVETFSGGTEATAFNKYAIAALQRAGFDIKEISAGDNPIYETTLHLKEPITKSLFSKTFDSSPNPKTDFAAIMVCTEADAGCPFVPGADARFAIPFEDPKNYDGTKQEAEAYDNCVRLIGREFFYAVHHAVELLINI